MIRVAVEKDNKEIYHLLKQIAQLHHRLYPEHFATGEAKYSIAGINEFIGNKNKLILVYEKDSKVAAYLIGWYIDDYFFVDDLCVNETYRGQSIGKQLLDGLPAYVTSSFIRLNVWHRNEQAVKFYEKLGFMPLKYVLEKKI